MKSEFVELLKRRVEKQFGRTILSSSDCQLLALEVFKHTGMKTSVNTLRRLFHLMRSQYQPSLFTLDLLAQYCSFSSFSDFMTSAQLVPGKNYSTLEISLFHLLIDIVKGFNGDQTAIDLAVVHEVENKLAPWPELLRFFKHETNNFQRNKNGEETLYGTEMEVAYNTSLTTNL